MKRTINTKNNQKGQILLIVVLLLATTLTVVMTVVFTSRTETKVTKLQQDADRSLVAAEAGIEAAIKNLPAGSTNVSFKDNSLSLGGLSNSGIDLANSNVTVDNATTSVFVSPIVQKDQQYTVFLAPYNNGVFGTSYYQSGGTLNLYYGSETSQCDDQALELTFINPGIVGNTYNITRDIADTGGILVSSGTNAVQTPHTITLNGNDYSFNCVKPLTVPANAILLFVRVIGNPISNNVTTRVGIDDLLFPAQGKTYYSTARTTSGVTKKVKVFQSYPQIPAELFVTSYTTTAAPF